MCFQNAVNAISETQILNISWEGHAPDPHIANSCLQYSAHTFGDRIYYLGGRARKWALWQFCPTTEESLKNALPTLLLIQSQTKLGLTFCDFRVLGAQPPIMCAPVQYRQNATDYSTIENQTKDTAILSRPAKRLCQMVYMLNEKLFFQHLEMFFQPYKTIFANCQLTNIKSSSKEYKKFDQKNFKVRPKNLKVRP